MAKVTLHNPQAPELTRDAGSPDLPALRESTAGVLTNDKQNSELIMTAVVEELGKCYGVTHAMVAHNASRGIKQEVIEELAAKCDWVLVGSSD